jgi:hypothetical protein
MIYLISGFHRASLLSVTFINKLMHTITTVVDVKIYVIQMSKRHTLKILQDISDHKGSITREWSIYLLIVLDTLLLRLSLHFTPLHYTFRHFTSSHLNFTQLHFTTFSFGLTPFKFPTAPNFEWSAHCKASNTKKEAVEEGDGIIWAVREECAIHNDAISSHFLKAGVLAITCL